MTQLGYTWLVEEIDYKTGKVLHSVVRESQVEAESVYDAFKANTASNTVTIERLERKLLTENE